MLKKNAREFQIDVNKDFYLPGDEITGTVKFDPRKPTNLSQLKINFTGDEYCAWTDRVAARMGQPVQPTKCPLFKKECSLVNERTRLEVRQYTWGFRFTVPRSVPPTLLYKKGQASIGYWLKVRASTGIGHFDLHFKVPIIIGQIRVPGTPLPKRSTYKTVGGNLSLEAVASRTVAKAGQLVKVNLHFNNSSHRNIIGIRLKLKQVWEVNGVFHHKNVIAKTVSKEGFPVGRGTHDCTIQLEVPTALRAVPTVTNANMFKTTYYLGVYGVTKMAGLMEKESVKCHLPIDISSTPLVPEDFDTVAPPAIPARSAATGATNNNTTRNPSVTNHSTSAPQRSALDFDEGPEYLYGRRALTRSRSATIDNIFFGLNNLDLGVGPSTERDNSAPNTTRTNNGWSVVTEDHSNDANGNSAMDAQGNIREYNPFHEPEATHDHDHNEEESSGGTKNSECVVCFDGAKNMLLLPCAHIATCVSCTTYIMNSTKQCPVCRTKVTQVVRTYAV
eukprot:TRINITY_DN661_c0_g1_i1.p1 TRINITY_DN661_c0_g1~~TRINITY_DN661_c0_g1_i1.p1  ORF type:complete len:503 (+),score=89.38 TRINITY_DN661_c0_g1_i1:115-1623(+)